MSQALLASYGGYSLFVLDAIADRYSVSNILSSIENTRIVFIYNTTNSRVYIINRPLYQKEYSIETDITRAFKMYIDIISRDNPEKYSFLYDDGNRIYSCIAKLSSPIQQSQDFIDSVSQSSQETLDYLSPSIEEMFSDLSPPNLDIQYNDKLIPTTPLKLSNPQEHVNVTYKFLKGGSNALRSANNANPVFKVNNCSLSNVTLSVKDVLAQVCNCKIDNVMDPIVIQKINDIKESIENNNRRISREDASGMYKFLYGKLNELIKIKIPRDQTMTDNCLYSYFAGPSAVKAIMDSIILGEIVTKSIEYNLSPCFMPLAVSDKDVEEYIKLGKTEGTKKKNTIDIYKFIDFWVSIEYCRVFQLITSDILGGVNAFYILRAIIDTTGFTGFISMPKCSGGSLGVDDKIAGYASFLSLLFLPNRVPICPVDKVDGYNKLVDNFMEIILADTGFIRYATEKDNIQSIIRSVNILMGYLNTSVMGSLPKLAGAKSPLFNSTYNTYKIITLFYEFIIANPGFNDLTNLTKLENPNMPVDGVVNPEWITWTCFQLSRYQQVRKFLVEDIKYEPPISIDQYLNSLELNRRRFCVIVKQGPQIDFTQALGVAINQIYKNEAFAGHDNNSAELTQAGINSNLIDKTFDRFIKKDKSEANAYVPNPQFIIGEVLREMKCTFFYKQYLGEHNNNNIWALGLNGPSIIEKRTGLVRDAPTNGLLEILTGPSDSNKQTTVATVIDFTKYYTETLLKLLSVEQSTIIEPKQKKRKLEDDQIHNKDESMYSDNVFDELLQEQLILNQIKPYNKITLFSTITGASDGSARTLTQNTVFITGEYKVVITLVDGITMEITFKSGDPPDFSPNLYINSSSPKDTDMDLIQDSKGIVINHLGSLGFNHNIGKTMSDIITSGKGGNNVHMFSEGTSTFPFQWNDIQKTNKVGNNNYTSFYKTLGASDPPDWLYKIFVESVLKNTAPFAQYMKEIDRKKSEGLNWRYIITLIAAKSPLAAFKLTDNLTLLGASIKNKNIEEAVAMCGKVIEVAKTPPKFYAPPQFLTEYRVLENVKEGFVQMNVHGNTVSLSLIDHTIFGDLDAIDTRSLKLVSLAKIENEISTNQLILTEKESFIAKIINFNTSGDMNFVKDTINYEIQSLRLGIKSLEEQKRTLELQKGGGRGGGGGGIEEVNYINKNIEIIKGKIYKLESDRFKITKIYDEISNLKAKKEQIMISMLKFTDVPISELELTKTAVFLGTDLFNKINLMVRENKLPYIEKIRFDVPLNVKDFVFPEGTSSKDFNDKIVFIQLISGVYYVESAEDRITEILKTRPAPIKKVIHRIEIKDRNENMRLITNQFKMVKVTAGGSKKRTLKRRNRDKKTTKVRKNKSRKNKKMTKRVPAKPRKKTKRIH